MTKERVDTFDIIKFRKNFYFKGHGQNSEKKPTEKEKIFPNQIYD